MTVRLLWLPQRSSPPQGGVVLVSHDERLIELVCKELWVVRDRMVTNLEGGLDEYRKQVYKQLQLAA